MRAIRAYRGTIDSKRLRAPSVHSFQEKCCFVETHCIEIQWIQQHFCRLDKSADCKSMHSKAESALAIFHTRNFEAFPPNTNNHHPAIISLRVFFYYSTSTTRPSSTK